VASLKKFNLEGKEVGHVDIDQTLAQAEANGQSIKDYIVALRANARQWSASTKTRSEVSHSTKKPHPQKGGGRARQGSLVSPQYKGGGRVFAPRPKFDQHVKVNRKERLAAIRALIGDKIRNQRVHILDSIEMKEPKTKKIAHFLEKAKMGKRVLFIGAGSYGEIEFADFKHTFSIPAEKHHTFLLSLRNIPKTEFALAKNLNGYDLALAQDLVITEEGLKELTEWLVG